MDGSGELELLYLGELRSFSFKNAELFKLQGEFGVSPFLIQRELSAREPSNLHWVVKIIQLGLQGAGVSPAKAQELTVERIGTGKDVSWVEAITMAALILTASLCGPISDDDDEADDEPGKTQGLETGP